MMMVGILTEMGLLNLGKNLQIMKNILMVQILEIMIQMEMACPMVGKDIMV